MRPKGSKYLGNSFVLTSTIDFRKLEAIAGEDEILIGYPEGLQHTPSFEGPAVDMADLARKLSYGAGPQTWKTNKLEVVGTTKTGKPKKARMVQTHHVDSIPARPFLEDGIENGTDEINGRIEKYYKQAIEWGQRNPSGLHAIAVTAIGAIQKWVRGANNYPPNSTTTIAAKGSDKPLIDTGQLLNSITYVVGNQVHRKVKGEDGKKEWTVT